MDVKVTIQYDSGYDQMMITQGHVGDHLAEKRWWCSPSQLDNEKPNVEVYEIDNNHGPWDVVYLMLKAMVGEQNGKSNSVDGEVPGGVDGGVEEGVVKLPDLTEGAGGSGRGASPWGSGESDVDDGVGDTDGEADSGGTG